MGKEASGLDGVQVYGEDCRIDKILLYLIFMYTLEADIICNLFFRIIAMASTVAVSNKIKLHFTLVLK